MDAFSTLHQGDIWLGTAPRSGRHYNNLVLAGGNSIIGRAREARRNRQLARYDTVKFLQLGATVSGKIFDAFVERRVRG